MRTFLLTWDASRTGSEWAAKRAAEFSTAGVVEFVWACGNTKRIAAGDRLFFLRQRMEPRGLIAIGYSRSDPYEGAHWDAQRAAAGVRALYLDTVWEYFSVNPVISRGRLDAPPFGGVFWNTQRSGISIPEETANMLESEFLQLVGQRPARSPDEVSDLSELPEGGVRRVEVNAYERNPEARRRCVAHYGTSCAACGVDLGAVYGAPAAGHIHVHHLCPVSNARRPRAVDPIADLRPVCPNCHSVIHLANPPYTVEQVRSMLGLASGTQQTHASDAAARRS